jgi:hypothetical protein
VSSSNRFERVDYEPEDAVTIRVFSKDGKTVADVSWPPRVEHGRIVSPALSNPHPVPDVLNQAIDLQRKHGFRRIVVMIEDEGLWQSEWGTLFS